jgi:hypothetical protein
MTWYELPLTAGQRRAAALVGVFLLLLAVGLMWVVGRFWPLWSILALAGGFYLRAAWRGAVAPDEDSPAPTWLRNRVLDSRVFRWLLAQRRPNKRVKLPGAPK